MKKKEKTSDQKMLQMIYDAAEEFQNCGCNTNCLWENDLAKKFSKKLPYNFERFVRFVNKALVVDSLRRH